MEERKDSTGMRSVSDGDDEGNVDSSNGTPKVNGRHPTETDALKMTAKFLMSNTAAGSIIGKGGSNISELQRTSNAKLQLSRPFEFFPGTNERVLTATGLVQQIVTVMSMILTACQEDIARRNEGVRDDEDAMELKFLAPSAVCGVLIGKAGVNIKTFAKESKTNITVSSLHEQMPGVSERIVVITGQIAEIVAALRLLLKKLQESRHYSRLSSVPVNYQPAAMDWGVQRFATNGLAQALPIIATPQPNGIGPHAETEVCLQVPDSRIGAIIGKGGEIITQIKNLFDVGIRISDRESFVPGTRDREVMFRLASKVEMQAFTLQTWPRPQWLIVISGPPHRVHLANQLIHERINNAELPGAPLTSRRRQ